MFFAIFFKYLLTTLLFFTASECPHGVVQEEDSQCFFQGEFYSIRDTIKQNCNLCKCQISLSNPNCMEWMCETEKCLVDEELLENLLQSQNYLSWTPMNYSQFWGRTLDEGRNGKLGTEAPMVKSDFILRLFHN